MIVIVEGLDGVGKTTFCKQFAELFNFEYIKGLKTDDNNKKIEVISLLKEQLRSKKNYIYDRVTLIDDFVYSFLNKQESTLNEYFKEIQQILRQCIIVHLYVDEETRRERFNKRGDEFVKNEDMRMISQAYIEYYKKLGCQINFIHLDNTTNEKIIKLLLNK